MNNEERLGMSLRSMEKTEALSLLKKTSASKVTFSPAMDKSPALKGKQSKLPDNIQAAILKRKGKKKEGAIDFAGGLSQASAVLYMDLYAKRGLEKQAFVGSIIKSLMPATKGALGAAGKAGAAGAIGAGLKRAAEIHQLSGAGVKGAFGARKAVLRRNQKRLAEMAEAKAAGKPYTPKAFDTTAEDVEILRKARGLKGKKLQDAPKDFFDMYSPAAKAALESGGAAALAGAAGKTLHNLHKRRKMIQAAKSVAVPAAIGLGGYALLKD